MALTDRFILNLKASGKVHKHFDGGGLHIHVLPTGGKLWRMSYRFNGKSKLLSFGAYPAVTLKMARDRREEAKSLLARDIDPGEHKKDLNRLSTALADNTFEAVGREWHTQTKDIWEDKRAKAVLSHFEKNVFPFIGKMLVAAVKAPDLLAIAKRIEERGANYYAHAVMQTCGRVFRYAIATGKAEHEITADLRGALTPHKGKHFASITDPRQVGQLLRAIDGYQGDFITIHVLKIAPLVFVRPSELRCAIWQEFGALSGSPTNDGDR